MNYRCVWLWMCIAGLAFISTKTVADDYSERMQFADGLYTREMHDLAIKEYGSILKAYPSGGKNDAATFRMAESLRLQEKPDTAGKLYSRIVVDYPQSPFRLRAAYRRARLYMDADDYQSAAAHFDVILLENPPAELAVATHYYLAESLLEIGKTDLADKSFASIIEQYPDSMFYAHALMGRGEIHRDRWVKAVKANVGNAKKINPEMVQRFSEQALGFFKKALERPASDRIAAEALFQIAEIYFRQHKFDNSSEYYHKLMTRFPSDERSASARMQAAWSASNAGLYTEAIKLAKTALADSAVTKNRDEWLYIKANAERQLMQNKEAVKSYLALLIKHSDSRFAISSRYEISVTYFKMGQYEDAIHHAETIRITPELRSDVCWLLAEAYSAMDRRAEAIQYYRMVIRDAPDTDRSRDALYRLAHQLQVQGEYREASQLYNKLVAKFPESDLAPQALYASAYSLEQAEAYDEAVRDWRRLITEYPKHELVQEAFYQKAMSEIRLERREAATVSLDELLRRYPESRFSADSYYWKGMLLYELKQYSASEHSLRSAITAASRQELKSEATFQLGLVLQKLDKDAEAANLFQQVLESPLNTKFSPALLEWLATYYDKQKLYKKSAKAAELLVEHGTEAGWVQSGWVLMGRALDKLDRKEEAGEAYKNALAQKVNTHYASEAALRLGDIAIANKNAAAATIYFKLATTKAPPEKETSIRARAFFGMGRAAELAGSNQDASRYYMSVAILYDHDELVPESLYRSAVAYNNLGRKDERNKAAQELKERYPESSWMRKVDKAWLN